MRKYPLSKKAVAIALATALAVTPFATAAADDGGETVQVQAEHADAGDLAERIGDIYEEFMNEDTVDGDVEKLNELIADLSGLGSKWEAIVDADAAGAYDTLNGKIHDGGAELHEVLDALVALFAADPDESFEDRLDQFGADYDQEFETVFGVTVAAFYEALLALDSHLTSEGVYFADTDTPQNLGFQDLVDAFLTAVHAKDNPTLNTMRTAVNDAGMDRAALEASVDALFQETGVARQDIALVAADLMTAAGVELKFGLDPAVKVGSDISTVERTKDEATGVTTVKVDINAESLTEALKDETEVREVRLELTRGADEFLEVTVSSSALNVVKDRNSDAKIVIVSNDGGISVPANQIDTDQLRTGLGGSGDDEVTIRFSANPTSDDNDVIGNNQLNVKSSVVAFNMTASIGVNTINLNRFTRPVERTITSMGDDFQAGTSVALRLNEDGTTTAVPTKVDGDRATFKGFSNSKYVIVENEASFTDVPADYWGTPYITKLANQMIFQGYVPGDFRPENKTTRAEFAALVTRSLGLSSLGYDGEFTDVDGSEWYADELAVAAEYGIVTGFTNGEYRPAQELTREEAAAMIVRAMTLAGDDYELDVSLSADHFVDASEISAWAFDYVDQLTKAGLLQGNPSGTVRPLDSSKRAEIAAMLERFLVTSDFLND